MSPTTEGGGMRRNVPYADTTKFSCEEKIMEKAGERLEKMRR